MSETAVLESSSTEVTPPPAMEVERGPLVNLSPEQRTEFRKTGELPTSKKEEATPSTAPGESETPATQEKPKNEPKPKQTAEERIAQLESTIEKIRKGSGLEKPKAESAPAKSEPIVEQSARPTPEDKKTDGTAKFETYAEYEEALVEWKIDQRDAAKALKAQEEASSKVLMDKVDEGRTRYENLDEVISPAANEIYQDPTIPPVIKQMIGDSDVIVDLVYTIGNDKAELAKFIKMAKETPGKAIRYIALTESLITQELESKNTAIQEEAPAKPKTQAPKPPSEAGGRAAAPPDSEAAAIASSGGKLTADVKAEFTRRQLAKLKG